MFALAVALGCDFFDSAAYALYAKENRYMTETGTLRLDELEYFPCTCPKCAKTSPKMVSELPENDRETFLAEHNLHVCAGELRRIKQAIKDGRLWEHLEMRAHGHPTLLQALKRLKEYQDFIEKNDSATKSSGLFYFDSMGLMRPEILRHRTKMAERYAPPRNTKTLLLAPQAQMKPFHKSGTFKELWGRLPEKLRNAEKVHVCFYAAPFGMVPMELDEVYPLSQHETVLPLDKETVGYVAKQVSNYITAISYKKIVLVNDKAIWNNVVLKACRKACAKRNIKFQSVNLHESTGKASKEDSTAEGKGPV
jgi:7-cyano-7-deazaguanine tRNA-ribosyltransferase